MTSHPDSISRRPTSTELYLAASCRGDIPSLRFFSLISMSNNVKILHEMIHVVSNLLQNTGYASISCDVLFIKDYHDIDEIPENM